MYYDIDGERVSVGDRMDQIKEQLGANFGKHSAEKTVVNNGEIELSRSDRKEILNDMRDQSVPNTTFEEG